MFLNFLDGLVELLEISYRSRAKFDPAKFRVILLNDTDAMTQNAGLIEVLKKELLESEGYSRATWAPSGAATKNTGTNSAGYAAVTVNIEKPSSPVVTQQYDCAVLIADGSSGANKAIASIASNAFQSVGHGLVAGDRVFFDGATAYPSGVSADTFYWVVSTSLTTDQFRIAATSGGSALSVGSSFTGALLCRCANGVQIGFEKVPIDGAGNNTRNLLPGQSLAIAVQLGSDNA